MSAIRDIRATLEVTQAELAAGIGVSQSNVSFYEKGQTMPPQVAARLIEFAGGRGLLLSFDSIYASMRDQSRPAGAKGAPVVHEAVTEATDVT